LRYTAQRGTLISGSVKHKQSNSTSKTPNNNNKSRNPNNNNNNNKSKKSSSKSNLSHLKCFYTNATSLSRDKLNELRTHVDRPDIIFITETWFTSTSVPELEGFNLWRRDRPDGYGGVCIYVSNELDSFEILDNRLQSRDIEQVWCKLGLSGENVLLGCIYRPRNEAAVNKKIQKSIERAVKLKHKGQFSSVAVVGDFNYPGIKWSSDGTPYPSNSTDTAFIEMLRDSGLVQHINFPTFQANHDDTEGNTLDLLLTDTPERVDALSHGPPLGFTDIGQGHKVITWNLVTKKAVVKHTLVTNKLNFGKGDYISMCDYLESLDWQSLLNNSDINDDYLKLTETYSLACSRFIPSIKCDINVNKKLPWITEEAQKAKRLKNKLYYHNQNPSWRLQNKGKYNRACKAVKEAIYRSVRDHEWDLVSGSKRDPKRIYRYIKQKQDVKRVIRSLRKPDGNVTSNPHDIVNILNNQFHSVFVDAHVESIGEAAPLAPEKLCSVESILNRLTPENVELKLAALNPNKASGSDKIHPRVLKQAARGFATPLCIMFKKSISSGTIPRLWKEANVSPIFKKGSRLDAVNYRPISLTSLPCKLLEGFVRETMTEHINYLRLFVKEQHGFVRNKSCVSNLLETLDYLTKLLAEGKSIDLIYLDFAKAFDTLVHALLLELLPTYGFDDGINRWIKSFLSDRRQRVVLGEFVSDWAEVTSGVPQGSVIGPLLFNLFINRLPRRIQSKSKLYADDTKLMGPASNDEERNVIQADLDNIVGWTDRALLRLNFEKCKVMHLGKNNSNYNYTIHDSVTNTTHSLIKTAEEKDLGVVFSSNLKWSIHIDKITHKANSVLATLKNTFTCRDKHLWSILYTSLIRPHLEYAAPIWNPTSEDSGLVKSLEAVQRRATKVGQPRLDYETRLNNLNLTKHAERRARGDCIELFKLIKLSGTPDELEVVLPLNSSTATTRRNNKALVRDRYRARTVNDFGPAVGFRHSFLTNRVNPHWNNLPSEVVDSPDVNTFKNNYDKYCSSRRLI
jgi:hypothetical protein